MSPLVAAAVLATRPACLSTPPYSYTPTSILLGAGAPSYVRAVKRMGRMRTRAVHAHAQQA